MKKTFIFACLAYIICFTTAWSVESGSESLLTGGGQKAWKLSQVFSQGQEANFDDCGKDDVYLFRSDFTFSIDPAQTPCNTDQKLVQGKWTLDKDELILDANPATMPAGVSSQYRLKLLELKDNKIHFFYAERDQEVTIVLTPAL